VSDIKISALPAGTAQPTGIIPVVNSGVTQRVTVKDIVDLATANVPAGTVDTAGNPVGITESAVLPIPQAIEEIIAKAVFNNYGASLSVLSVQSPSWSSGNVGGDGTILANGAAFGELFYGSLIGRDASGRASVTGGYQLPTPTEQGYLRADQDPATGWYFAEPVIVSDTPPPTPPGDPALPVLWIDPTGTSTGAGTGEFTTDSPITFADAPIVEQEDGTPIGLSADGLTFHQPLITGAIPVVVNGKKYLIPLVDC
jgi:hypothetical protein